MRLDGIDHLSTARATECRRELGVADEPIDIIKLLRENLDISIIFKQFTANISGMFIRTPTAEVIVLNTAKSLGHQRFTAAHEYCHLRYEKELTHRICNAAQFTTKLINEQYADMFAACLLMPTSAIAHRLDKRGIGKIAQVAYEDVIDLEQYFGVSHASMLVRLRQIGYITAVQTEQMKPGIIDSARRLGYDISLYRRTDEEKIYSSYAEKAKRALDEGLITEGRYEQLLLEAGLSDLLYGSDEEEANEDI